MTRYGYALVHAREDPDPQRDALARAGVTPDNIVIDIGGKSASQPELDGLLDGLRPGDQVVVTRLRRVGRDRRHLADLAAWFEQHGADLVVLEQGIDTSTPTGRMFFGVMSALAEFDRELAAPTRGRRPKLTPDQVDQARRMHDEGKHPVGKIAEAFGVSRSTMFRCLGAHKDDQDCVLVVYRNTRRHGETGQGEEAQYEADCRWHPIAPDRRSHVKGLVYVTDGTVTRVRAVRPDGQWREDDRGYAEAPLTRPLTEAEIAEQFPTLGLRPGHEHPHTRGRTREYLPL